MRAAGSRQDRPARPLLRACPSRLVNAMEPATPTRRTGESPVRVLVVDDDCLLRRVVAERLRKGNVTVVEAGNVEEASDLMTHRPFDLIVSDLVLPDADGVALLAAARRDQPRAEVLLMTADPEALTRADARRWGAKGLIIKRPDLRWVDDILAALEALCG